MLGGGITEVKKNNPTLRDHSILPNIYLNRFEIRTWNFSKLLCISLTSHSRKGQNLTKKCVRIVWYNIVFIKLVFLHRKTFQIMRYFMISRGSMKTLGFLSCDGGKVICKNKERRMEGDCGLHNLTLSQPCFIKILRMLLLFCTVSQIVWHFILWFLKYNPLLNIHNND